VGKGEYSLSCRWPTNQSEGALREEGLQRLARRGKERKGSGIETCTCEPWGDPLPCRFENIGMGKGIKKREVQSLGGEHVGIAPLNLRL